MGNTVYEQLGGMDTFMRLANAFYDRIEADAFLRPMFPGSLHCARKHLGLFIAQFFGGPRDYDALRGSPRLRMRHQPFAIGQAERDRWLGHMLAAIDAIGIAEPARTVMVDYFTSASTFLINRPGPGDSPQQVAPAQVKVALAYEIAVERAYEAIRTGDASALAERLAHPTLRSRLAKDRVAYRDIVGAALASANAELRTDARARLVAEPDLVHVRGEVGLTLLHEAARAWRRENAEFLLDLGADANAAGAFEHTPLYEAANHFTRRDPLPPEDGARVARLLLDRGADPNAVSGPKRVTPLHMAARRGHAPIAAELIERGADLEARDINGETPLRRAVNCGHAKVAALLLSRGADANTRDKAGRTPTEAARTAAMRALLGEALGR